MNDIVKCANCNWTGDANDVKEIKDLWERVTPGDTFPAGECPKCGCLVYPVGEFAKAEERPEPRVRVIVFEEGGVKTGELSMGELHEALQRILGQ